MTKIKYAIGDATRPKEGGNKIIIHICNDCNKWGAGFVMALSRRWKEPEMRFRALKNPKLGDVEFVSVEKDISVANIIGQHGIMNSKDGPPIRYEAVRQALKEVCQFAKSNNATVVGPRLGSGLAGGDWDEIEKILIEELILNGIEVVIYDLPAVKKRIYSW